MLNTVFITGGAKRIGRAIAFYLLSKGYNLAIHYRKSSKEAKELQSFCMDQGKECRLYQADLSNITETTEMFQQVLNDFPRLNLLINNASVFQRAPLLNTEPDLLNQTFTINFFVPYLLSQAFGIHIKNNDQAGQIINLIDTKVNKHNFFYSAYTLSKQALYHLTLQSAKELAPHIRVNGICPGVILAPEGTDQEYLEPILKHVPLGKKGTVEEITQTVGFLLDNQYLTGQVIYVDGGQHI
ncbi:MAG: SDR family oxidoreductase [Spirochaetes bacterium]|nr:SDR family oxidoreductase [Spirochaetota bacterium]